MVSEWRPVPNPLVVRIASPSRPDRGIVCNAVLNLTIGIPTVPTAIYEELALPEWAHIEFEGQSTAISIKRSDDAFVHVSLALLTALGLEINRTTHELRSFEPLLPLMLVEETS